MFPLKIIQKWFYNQRKSILFAISLEILFQGHRRGDNSLATYDIDARAGGAVLLAAQQVVGMLNILASLR